ncbi:VOC family protein [Palleronia sediminis]|uniref:VOC family protein n=1 Tax=Palleronia sediminis TaxID=2547833 RepID=A0A4R6ABW7_9RHOB|nr:VOC family protein [Palleronia sediminis]TDL81310.1 VOC family protein [Palleronia sediminis]
MTVIDHIVIVADDLARGAAAVEAALGVAMQATGRHAAMGTHNRLLSLGPDAYLEVIAIDPDAPAPDRPRWFDLDRVSGPPRLAQWVARVDDLDAAQAGLPFSTGTPMAFSRDALEWRMAVPPDGVLPFDGVVPALIEWRRGMASTALPDSGCRLRILTLRHPRMHEIRTAWPGLAAIPGVETASAAAPALAAAIETPDGLRHLPAGPLDG